jgi:hypothetical protein
VGEAVVGVEERRRGGRARAVLRPEMTLNFVVLSRRCWAFFRFYVSAPQINAGNGRECV